MYRLLLGLEKKRYCRESGAVKLGNEFGGVQQEDPENQSNLVAHDQRPFGHAKDVFVLHAQVLRAGLLRVEKWERWLVEGMQRSSGFARSRNFRCSHYARGGQGVDSEQKSY